MLLTFRDLNSRELNEKLSLFLREIIEQGFAYKLFTLKTLQILHSIATGKTCYPGFLCFFPHSCSPCSVDEAKRIDVDISKPNLRQTASNLLYHFTRSLLSEFFCASLTLGKHKSKTFLPLWLLNTSSSPRISTLPAFRPSTSMDIFVNLAPSVLSQYCAVCVKICQLCLLSRALPRYPPTTSVGT